MKNNNQGRIFGALLSFILMVLITTAVLASYPVIEKNYRLIQDKEETLWADMLEERDSYYKDQFIEGLNRSNYVLFLDIKEQLSGDDFPVDILLSKNFLEADSKEEDYDDIVYQFNELMDGWSRDFYYQLRDVYQTLDFYIVDHGSESVNTNTIDPLEQLLDAEASKELKSIYPFYVILDYLEDGSLQVVDYKGLTKDEIDKYRLNELNKSEFTRHFDNIYSQSIKDMIENPSDVTIIYASKSDKFYIPVNDSTQYLSTHGVFAEAGFAYSFIIAFACIGLMAIFLPFVKSWGVGDSPLGRIPFEISATGVTLAAASYVWLSRMAQMTIKGYFVADPAFTVISEKTLKILDYVVNYAAWILVLLTLYVCLLSLRKVFTLGLVRYFKEMTILGVILLWFAKLVKRIFKAFTNKHKVFSERFTRLVKRIFRSLGKINLTDSSNKAIMKILAVNFIILLIMMSVWAFGIPILILYTIILFFILRKYLDDIKNKYTILLSATSRIAEGNLEGTIDVDLGVFEPLKDELSKVQIGFKKAVEEEIKSQRLKTDLITNVSHDLKTPLTAIITYINLLKDDNITVEERASYIDTLDKKSQRLKRLIEDLFEVSKASSNNITINKVEIDIVNLIEQVLLELDDKIKESHVEFRFYPPEDKVVVNLDSEKTYRIFENLIINITKYAMPYSRAYIDIGVREGSVVIILKNVSASELDFNLEVISERFVRGDESRNTEGSGLGLAIVKSFVELQDGKFSIQTDGDLFKAILEFPI